MTVVPSLPMSMNALTLIFLIASLVVGITNMILHITAPLTKTKVDDEIVALLDKIESADLLGKVKQFVVDEIAKG